MKNQLKIAANTSKNNVYVCFNYYPAEFFQCCKPSGWISSQNQTFHSLVFLTICYYSKVWCGWPPHLIHVIFGNVLICIITKWWTICSALGRACGRRLNISIVQECYMYIKLMCCHLMSKNSTTWLHNRAISSSSF